MWNIWKKFHLLINVYTKRMIQKKTKQKKKKQNLLTLLRKTFPYTPFELSSAYSICLFYILFNEFIPIRIFCAQRKKNGPKNISVLQAVLSAHLHKILNLFIADELQIINGITLRVWKRKRRQIHGEVRTYRQFCCDRWHDDCSTNLSNNIYASARIQQKTERKT